MARRSASRHSPSRAWSLSGEPRAARLASLRVIGRGGATMGSLRGNGGAAGAALPPGSETAAPIRFAQLYSPMPVRRVRVGLARSG